MGGFFKVFAVLLIALSTLNSMSVKDAYFSSIQDDQAVSLTAADKASHQSIQIAQAIGNADQGKDCDGEGRHPAHHHCHQGHCGFAVSLTSLNVELDNGLVSSFIPSESSLIGVELAGPRKPPRA